MRQQYLGSKLVSYTPNTITYGIVRGTDCGLLGGHEGGDGGVSLAKSKKGGGGHATWRVSDAGSARRGRSAR